MTMKQLHREVTNTIVLKFGLEPRTFELSDLPVTTTQWCVLVACFSNNSHKLGFLIYEGHDILKLLQRVYERIDDVYIYMIYLVLLIEKKYHHHKWISHRRTPFHAVDSENNNYTNFFIKQCEWVYKCVEKVKKNWSCFIGPNLELL